MKFFTGIKATIPALCIIGLAACAQVQQEESEPIVYGPIDQAYELPQTAGKIYFVAPDGAPTADGLSLDKPTSIEAAIERVVTGDAIVMRGGEYRTGNLEFNQGITIQPYNDEKPVIKGCLIADNWQQDADGLWFTEWEYLFPGVPESWWVRQWNEKNTPLHRFNNDAVFIDGQLLQSAGSKEELNEETFLVDYDNKKIYLAADPSGKTVEITAFRKAIHRVVTDVHGKSSDGRGPVIKGLLVTMYPDTMVHIDGYYPQGVSAEEEHGKDVIGTVFENCTFSKSLRICVFAIGDSMVMRNCKIEDSNTEGLYIVASSDVLLERNIFGRNNIEKWTGFYPSAVKIFNQTHRVVCRENLITDNPFSNGLWYDVGNKDGIFINNRVENVGRTKIEDPADRIWGGMAGFFFEISEHVTVVGNTFVNNDMGVWILNSRSAEVYNNTFINSTAAFSRNSRGDGNDHFGWHIDTAPGVDERENHVFVNNLMIHNAELEKPMVNVSQPANMCERLPNPAMKVSDNNVYVTLPETGETTLISWSPFANEECNLKVTDLADFQAAFTQFEANSGFYANYQGVAPTTDSDKVVAEFEGHKFAAPIPEHIQKIAGWNLKEGETFIGAK